VDSSPELPERNAAQLTPFFQFFGTLSKGHHRVILYSPIDIFSVGKIKRGKIEH
jgi:hypothetical protein